MTNGTPHLFRDLLTVPTIGKRPADEVSACLCALRCTRLKLAPALSLQIAQA